jgi:hypothetical protein
LVSLGFFPSLEAFKRQRHEIRAGGKGTGEKDGGNTGKEQGKEH